MIENNTAPGPSSAGPAVPRARPTKIVLVALIFPLFMAIALPGLYLAAFHQPSPDHMRVEIIGDARSAQELAQGMTSSSQGAFDAATVADTKTALSHLEDMSSRGAYDPTSGVLYVASAGSPAAEQAVATVFADVAADDGMTLTVQDVVPLPDSDRLGVTFLFLGLAGVLVGFTTATVLGVAVGGMSLRRELGILASMSALAGIVTTFIGYSVYGALTTDLLAVGLLISAISVVSGLIQSGGLKLIGPGMTVLSIILLILLGVPASGAGVPADMTPGFFADLQTLLPSSAALDALRRVIYFGGNGIGPDLAALAFWGLVGGAMIALSRLKSPHQDSSSVLESPFAADESLDEDEARTKRNRLTAGVLALPVFFAIFLPLLFVGVFHSPQPNGMDIAIVGTGTASDEAAQQLRLADTGDAFDVTNVPDRATAIGQLQDLEIRAAYDATTGEIYVSSAAGAQSAAVATQVLTSTAESAGLTAAVDDVAPLDKKDPVGTSLLYLSLGAVVGGFLAAVVVALTGPKVAAAWQAAMVVAVAVVVSAIEVLFGWGLFDIFSGQSLAAFGLLLSLALVSGLVTLAGLRTIGPAQIMVSVLILILAAVSSSGMAVQLDMAPSFYGFIHEILPTSQGISAMRGAVYFDGAGVGKAVAVMLIWTLAAVAVITVTARRRPDGKHVDSQDDDASEDASQDLVTA